MYVFDVEYTEIHFLKKLRYLVRSYTFVSIYRHLVLFSFENYATRQSITIIRSSLFNKTLHNTELTKSIYNAAFTLVSTPTEKLW